VHRDLKPANIMVDEAGRPKVLDFGLVKLFETGARVALPEEQVTVPASDSPTVAGSVLGTPDYMSPEQAEGRAIDHRTDLFSLGVIFYEMATGKHPFRADSPAATISSILRDTPSPATEVQSHLPRHLGRIIERCLAKEPERRYQSALDLRNDLEGLKRECESGHHSRARRSWIVGAVVVAVAAMAFVYWNTRPGPESPTSGDSHRTMIAVLPFDNLGDPEEEYFSDGITDAITARLAGFRDLGVISRQSSRQYKGTAKTIRQIGEELGVDYILEGTVQRERVGDPVSRLRVIPQLIRVLDDTHVWATTYDEDMVEVFRMQSEIAERVANQLNITLLRVGSENGAQSPTTNLDAYDTYLRALARTDSYIIANNESGIQLLREAVSLDPGFAEAWAQLAMSYFTLYWGAGRPGALSQQTAAANRARELGPDLPETQLALGFVEYANRRFAQALVHFEAAQNSRPGAEPLKGIGFALRRLGRWQEALHRFEEAAPLAPRDYKIQYDGLGNTCVFLRRFDEAERHYDRAISLRPDVVDAYLDKAYLLVARNGNHSEAARVLRDMTSATDIAQAAHVEHKDIYPCYFRIFPEAFTEAFDAFDEGLVDQHRESHPAMVASAHLARAVLLETMGDRNGAIARYDSARVHFDRIIRSSPQTAHRALYLANLGFAQAGLGHCAEAIRLGTEAVQLVPMSKDAIHGTNILSFMPEIYVMCGEHEAAIDQLEILLSVPSWTTSAWLRADPIWDPVRDNARFRALMADP
jgi:serine/threonine-protein kinase